MKNKRSFIVICMIVVLGGCTTTRTNKLFRSHDFDPIAYGKILTAAYQQKAAEYKALCYQAYNIAQVRLDEFMKEETPMPKAIMTDIDETFLDNSPNQVHQSLMGKGFDNTSWHQWTDEASADTMPGALRFFQYAAAKGVEIFYVTNRDQEEKESTLKNLKKYGFPFADNDHLRLKSVTSSKVPRRDSILMNYTIIMQLGDNLNDMNGGFEKGSMAERSALADAYRSEFGKRYIVLPNPSYGEWENALYHYRFDLTPAYKDSLFRAILRDQ